MVSESMSLHWRTATEEELVPSSCRVMKASHTVLGAPPEVFPGMEQRGGAGGGGTENPGLQDRDSPDERGDSPASSGPPPGKLSRLEVNGSPANHRSRQNGTPLRPLGVEPSRKHSWPGGCGLLTPAADSCAERATRCLGFHAPSLFHWFPLQPAEPLPAWINTGCSSAVPPWARSSARFAARRLALHKAEQAVFGFKFTLSHCFVTFPR
ncbi:DNA-binding protein SATB2-like protein [Lates japonicus]|uniref:DNA-binding protein SATB2-like protein n=1 Tax=Lates japonicus TaxID=270547 RepID=A0AAD3RHV8_LATJO|nr:DNA-binding protein SATB2-like protein [Lates japonicus]